MARADTEAEYTEGEAWDDPADEGGDEHGLYGEGVDDPIRHANPRRNQATILMVVASGFFLLSLIVLAAFTVGGSGFRGVFDFWSFRTWIWILFAVMMALFVWMLVLLLTSPTRERDDWFEDEGEIPVAQPGALGAPDTITLRCPDCVNIFSLQDPMSRPFYHDCPNCGVRGVYTGKDDPPEVVARLERQGHGTGA